MKPVRVEAKIAGKTIAIETGQVARQAGGAVICTLGDTKVFAAVCAGSAREDIDFFPLVVDYREKTEAAGKIPGGFFKREGRPTTKEILTMRLIDRSIRPMFPDGYKDEVQVMTHVLQYDGVNNPDVLAMIAAFAAIRISGLPFGNTLGAVRIARIDEELSAWPTDEERRTESELDLVVAGHKDGLAMVESSADQLPEDVMIDALEMAGDVIRDVVDLIDQLGSKLGAVPREFVAPAVDENLKARVWGFEQALTAALDTEGKHERSAACKAVEVDCVEQLLAGVPDDQQKATKKSIKTFFHDLQRQVEREQILSGRRSDGRSTVDIRQITIEPNFIERQHGSVLFTRGETQALVSATLGTPDDEQIIDGVEKEYRKNFYLHYNFPPYSVGETRRIMGPGRREIGHGMLAERALKAVMPPKESFPYTVRIVSDIMESNGSSSMASVCGGCLSMMLAGVPISQPVAGIAMGLVQEGDRTAILSDILGSEDHNGDMDFKVAGSGVGITALQMDIKIQGVSRQLLETALEQARAGRIHILHKMLEAVPRPSKEVSRFAPRFESIKIPGDKIGFLIGPGGKNIKAMQSEYEVKITILDDEGNVQVFGTDPVKVQACKNAIKASTETPEVGTRYKGVVRSVRDFGAFVEILPGVEGLCHISELANGFVGAVTDEVNVGDEIEVEIIAVDDRGRIKVSRKAVMGGGSEDEGRERSRGRDRDRAPEDRGDRRPRRERPEFEDDADGEPEERPARSEGGRGRDRGDRDRGPRGDRPRGDRDDRPRADREDRPRGDRGDREDRPRADREDRPRGDRDDRPRGGRDRDRDRDRDRGGDRERGDRERGDREQSDRGRDRDRGPERDRNDRDRGDRDRSDRGAERESRPRRRGSRSRD
ncbi:MAG: polyribonucleotide nucleotidyltransferase [Planctomycetes bacterium]|nr:polyribonucleotide nucleotidyltransferase [Planctomycetota bacterium]MCB9908692.1 polyribonucleotide nucleotidyltransferase [Planctomycetota bacterium]MCB9913161.1 polyribonucleotide nucleotidyltransferase [Planctomycetota bacterium]